MSIPVWQREVELAVPGSGGSPSVPSRITESELVAAFSDEGCHWEVIEYGRLADQRTLQTSPTEEVRVSFTFIDRESYDAPPGDDWILSNVNVWGLAHRECPEQDRNLPDDGYGV
ncbi:hypothetical protein [Streptomyces sp. SID1034]|uniref:hypothetical protein n=1 Tax=Streptomyces sp. SID1034 TaxID=2690248 RepID=UPI001369ECBF|nr:hypothetical protein [Streptomyces sp. SID1034]MYV90608.1 hypothetical protein [Streptomyces sp. SID1034]